MAKALHRLGVSEDVAGVAVWLASDLANYVNGAAVMVDSGLLRAYRRAQRKADARRNA
jgi:NAD(P)-dependent dehydrogenase (short-subunit alcohol dehydrogenase family)